MLKQCKKKKTKKKHKIFLIFYLTLDTLNIGFPDHFNIKSINEILDI